MENWRVNKMGFEFHVHGLWILGAILALVASMLAGNIQWVEGTTQFSYYSSIFLAFVLFLFVGVCWISASVNAANERK